MTTNKEDYLGARFRKKEADMIRELAELRAESVSTFLRRATLRELSSMDMLDNKTKRALGFEVVERG